MNPKIKLLLIFWVTLVVFIPIWWKTTEIYRPDLKIDNVQNFIQWTRAISTSEKVLRIIVHPISTTNEEEIRITSNFFTSLNNEFANRKQDFEIIFGTKPGIYLFLSLSILLLSACLISFNFFYVLS